MPAITKSAVAVGLLIERCALAPALLRDARAAESAAETAYQAELQRTPEDLLFSGQTTPEMRRLSAAQQRADSRVKDLKMLTSLGGGWRIGDAKLIHVIEIIGEYSRLYRYKASEAAGNTVELVSLQPFAGKLNWTVGFKVPRRSKNARLTFLINPDLESLTSKLAPEQSREHFELTLGQLSAILAELRRLQTAEGQFRVSWENGAVVSLPITT